MTDDPRVPRGPPRADLQERRALRGIDAHLGNWDGPICGPRDELELQRVRRDIRGTGQGRSETD
jgi:hypothetical protein